MANQNTPTKKLVNKSTSKQGLREGYTRATFILRDEIVNDLDDIAHHVRKYQKTLVNEILSKYITEWKKNPPVKKKGKKT